MCQKILRQRRFKLHRLFRARTPLAEIAENLYRIGMKFRVHVETDEDGVFVAECPTLPGCISQGKTRSEALTNIKDAIAGYLVSLEKHGEAIPLPVNEEVVEVPA
jgi:antitoxin HicB